MPVDEGKGVSGSQSLDTVKELASEVEVDSGCLFLDRRFDLRIGEECHWLSPIKIMLPALCSEIRASQVSFLNMYNGYL